MGLIDADALAVDVLRLTIVDPAVAAYADAVLHLIQQAPTIDAEPVRHGRWVLTAHKESANYGWNVTADCPECGYEKGEIYAAYFPGFPDVLARDILMDNAQSVKLDNYCPNCGVKMDGGVSDGKND